MFLCSPLSIQGSRCHLCASLPFFLTLMLPSPLSKACYWLISKRAITLTSSVMSTSHLKPSFPHHTVWLSVSSNSCFGISDTQNSLFFKLLCSVSQNHFKISDAESPFLFSNFFLLKALKFRYVFIYVLFLHLSFPLYFLPVSITVNGLAIDLNSLNFTPLHTTIFVYIHHPSFLPFLTMKEEQFLLLTWLTLPSLDFASLLIPFPSFFSH